MRLCAFSLRCFSLESFKLPSLHSRDKMSERGPPSTPVSECGVENHVISAEEIISNFLPLPAAILFLLYGNEGLLNICVNVFCDDTVTLTFDHQVLICPSVFESNRGNYFDSKWRNLQTEIAPPQLGQRHRTCCMKELPAYQQLCGLFHNAPLHGHI